MPSLELCLKLDVAVVLVSSKTRAEIQLLRQTMPVFGPFVSENGGGVFFPSDNYDEPPLGVTFSHGLAIWSFGVHYDELVAALRSIRDEMKWDIKGFSDMSVEEISRRTGLDERAASLAAMREYDEPFIAGDKHSFDVNAMFDAAEKRGLTVTFGGRFYHLKGENDKGSAVMKVISWYKEHKKRVVSIGLGDSPNDFSMLEQVDYPVLLGSKWYQPELKEKIPSLKVTREGGPLGWNTVVLEMLGKK